MDRHKKKQTRPQLQSTPSADKFMMIEWGIGDEDDYDGVYECVHRNHGQIGNKT